MFYKTRIIFFVPLLFSITLAQSGLAIKADNAQVQEDESVKINVLRNDNIVDKTNLSIEIKTEPTMGTVAIKDNKIIYTPNANVNGVASNITQGALDPVLGNDDAICEAIFVLNIADELVDNGRQDGYKRHNAAEKKDAIDN